MPSAFPFPPPTFQAPHFHIGYPSAVATAPPTPTGHQHAHPPIQYIPFDPKAPPARSCKVMTSKNLMNRITNEYVAKVLSTKGFSNDSEATQLSLVTEIFCVLETKYFDKEGLPGREEFIKIQLPKIPNAVNNNLHLSVFLQLRCNLGAFYPDMKVPPDAKGPARVGSSHWNAYTADHAKALGGERGLHPPSGRLFLHEEIPGGLRWYENHSLKEIVITFLFSKAASLGNAFPELFESISLECWAYFATMDINEFELSSEDTERSDRFKLTEGLLAQFAEMLEQMRRLYKVDLGFQKYLVDLVVEARARFTAATKKKKSKASTRQTTTQTTLQHGQGDDGAQMGQEVAGSSSSILSSSLAGALGY